MTEKLYGIWLPEQRPPGWWIDASGVPFHTLHRCVAMALLLRMTSCDGDVEIIGEDGRPEKEEVKLQEWQLNEYIKATAREDHDKCHCDGGGTYECQHCLSIKQDKLVWWCPVCQGQGMRLCFACTIARKPPEREEDTGYMSDLAGWARPAYQSMAESMKKGVDELSAEERQQAWLNAMIERGIKKTEIEETFNAPMPKSDSPGRWSSWECPECAYCHYYTTETFAGPCLACGAAGIAEPEQDEPDPDQIPIAHPCPFCGSGSLDMDVLGKTYRVECLLCHARGAKAGSARSARELWNRRKPPWPEGQL